MTGNNFYRLKLVLCSMFLIMAMACTISHSAQEAQKPPVPPTPVTQKAEPVQFIAFGDWGSGMLVQMRTAKAITDFYKKSPFEFVLTLGDNFYRDGNVKKYAEERFNKPYRHLLDNGVKFYASLGNHDYLGGFEQDQIAFFKMPKNYYDFVRGNVHFYAIDTNHFNGEQKSWLEKRLSQSTEPWKIVYGHHPIYSSGEHGDSSHLKQALQPVLEAHHVDFYLAGHDHDYERFAPKNGVTYVVSGGGGASIRTFQAVKPGSVVRKATHHFMVFEVMGNHLKFQVIDSSGKVIDSGSLMKGPNQQRPAA